jgi:PPM family protein phosphatase
MHPLRYAGHSDAGLRRSRNDDRWGADPALGLFMVADGVATSTNGGAAAQLAIELLPEYVRRHLTQQNLARPDGAAGFGEAVAHVSDDMHERGQTDSIIAGASTTIVAAVIAPPRALFAHLGDSRAYLHRDQSVQQLTRDHTLIQTLIDEHGITAANTASNPARGVITRYVTMKPPALPDVRALDLQRGDRILLCTDGLHDVVDDMTLATILSACADPDDACRALIDAANRGGGPDNATAVVIDVL